MKLLHLKSTIITINQKNSLYSLQHQFNHKNHKGITQLSISHCNCSQINEKRDTNKRSEQHFPDNIEILNFKYCIFSVVEDIGVRLKGKGLRFVEISYCKIRSFPVIEAECLTKLNISHNYIEVVEDINSGLKILDVRDNNIKFIALSILTSNTTILHEFLPQNTVQLKALNQKLIKLNSNKTSCFLRHNKFYQGHLISIQFLLKLQVYEWNKTKIIQTCQSIINNDNQILFNQIQPYLDENFINTIFQICKFQDKYKIMRVILNMGLVELNSQEKIKFLMPELIDKMFLARISMDCLIESISKIKEKDHLSSILNKIHQLSAQVPLISSQKDLINYINLNTKYHNKYQQQLLLTQSNFFKDYQFTNHSILKHLLLLDNYKLIKPILILPAFMKNVFQTNIINSSLNNNFKTYKLLKKSYKKYLKDTLQTNNEHNNSAYLPEYKERRSICLKSDLYDYNILIEYQEMQGSYLNLNKNKKTFILKFYNKENQMSIAKRIGNQLKKQYWKKEKINFRNKTISLINQTQ